MAPPLSRALVDWLVPQARDAAGCIELDTVIVGSGYGGSVAALRLSERGHRVVVLERGSEYLPGEFPNTAGQLVKFARVHGPDGPIGNPNGLFDLRVGQGLGALVASGLGGGSLINAGVMMRPDPDVLGQPEWPAEIRHALDGRQPDGVSLEAGFERAGQMLGTHSAESLAGLPKARAHQRLASVLNAATSPAELTIDLAHCTKCGDCFTGCNVPGAKRTLTSNYLAKAEAHGAELVTRCLVHALWPTDDGRWAVRVLATEHAHDAQRLSDAVAMHGHTLLARRVVLAAGTFGSTELLLRSQRLAAGRLTLSPALGTRLSGNGDSITALADLPEVVGGVGRGAQTGPDAALAAGPEGAGIGPTITTVIDRRDRLALDERLVIQDGAAPGALARAYQEILATTWSLHHLGRTWRTPRSVGRSDPLAASPALARHTQMLLTMGHDGSAGRIVWLPEMDGAVPYWVRPEEQPTHRHQQRVFDTLQRGSGGAVHLHTPLWRALPAGVAALADPPLPEPVSMTVHPLGGCPMGDSFAQGVVNHLGQVWKGPNELWPGLQVLDGSIVPTSLGCNPLWTITALAERAMAYEPAHAPAACGPGGSPPKATAPRVPRAPRAPVLTDSEAQVFDLSVSERLVQARLPLRGALHAALARDAVQADLQLDMRAHDWSAVWDQDPLHRLTQVQGRLRLVAVPADDGAPSRRAEYRVASGHIDLFAWSPSWPVLGVIRGLAGLPRVGLTWWLMRGRRDLARDGWPLVQRLLREHRTVLALAWQATQQRQVRYDLQLALHHQLDAPAAPQHLHLVGVKDVGYAASWSQIFTHIARRWGRPRGDDDHSGVRRPQQLRLPLAEQLTQPRLWLYAQKGAGRGGLPAWRADAAAQFSMDLQSALRDTPAAVHGPGDSVEAMQSLLAYPALLGRWLLLTRGMEWRRPDYSNRPVLDDASAEDVALRVVLANGKVHALAPEETTLWVPRGHSSSDDGREDPSPLPLRLWRYRQIDLQTREPVPTPVQPGSWCGHPVRQARVVLLMHAFDMSGLSFTFKTTDRNFAEHLHAQGWEVWILDSRMSPRTRAAIEPCTVDQLGLIDAPAAVDHILAVLAAELDGPATGVPPDPLQIHAFGQCMGAAALLIGLLHGRLSYPLLEAPHACSSAGHRPPLCPKLASLVTSQTHPFVVGSRAAQTKTRIPAWLRDLAGRTMVPLAVRGPVVSLAETLADRLFSGLPVPAGEHCPAEGEVERQHDDDCATCRRVRFLLGGMYAHAQINAATHAALPRLFGAGSVRLFAQGAKFFDQERLCSEDGFHVHATDDAIARHLALPLRFVHGELNDLFDAESARRSAAHFRRIHPGWADAFGCRDPGGDTVEVCDIIEGHGHLDVLIGQHAMRSENGRASTYDRLAALLNEAWSRAQAAPSAAASPAPVDTTLRLPQAGPFFGPVVESDGQRRLGLAFVLDNGQAHGRQGPDDHAIALVWPRGRRSLARLVPLEVSSLDPAVPALHGFRGPGRGAGRPGLRVAHGQVALVEGMAACDLRIECASHTAGLALTPASAWQAIADARAEAAELVRLMDLPFAPTLSAQRRQPGASAVPRAMLPRAALASPAATGPAQAPTQEAVQVLLGCCRSPGLAIDHVRAEQSLRQAWQALHQGSIQPQMLLMLGGQIYAERPLALAEPLSAMERYLHRHHQSFTTAAMRRLLASLPAVCLPDDHEFIDDYPAGRPLFRGEASRPAYALRRERLARETVRQAARAYQCMALPETLRTQGWFTCELGDVRFFVLDTWLHRRRSARAGVRHIIHPLARQAFAAWLEARDAQHGPGRLHVLVSASALFPARLPGADPASPRVSHTLIGERDERAWLLTQLMQHVPGRFLLVSGDHHHSGIGTIQLGDTPVGAWVLAPPWHAPMRAMNLPGDALWMQESVTLPDGTCLSLAAAGGLLPRPGSGHGVLRCVRTDDRWSISLEVRLDDPVTQPPWPPVLL